MSIVIKVENLSKQYRLGTVGTGTLSHDAQRWWAKVRGKEDPFQKVGYINNDNRNYNFLNNIEDNNKTIYFTYKLFN